MNIKLFFQLMFMIIFLYLITGCAQFDAASQAVLIKGAQINDRALESAETIICRAASVGSIQRKYGQDAEKSKAWRTLCIQQNEFPIINVPKNKPEKRKNEQPLIIGSIITIINRRLFISSKSASVTGTA